MHQRSVAASRGSAVIVDQWDSLKIAAARERAHRAQFLLVGECGRNNTDV